jgi:Phage gp6-like head-tail connector protein
MALDTLANVKARLGITTSADDALLDLLRDSADAFVVNHCRRDFAAGPFTEYHPGDAVTLRLRNYPGVAVTSLKVDRLGGFGPETVVDASAYVVDADRGVVVSRRGPFAGITPGTEFGDFAARAPRAVQVVYTASGTVPNDVKQAYAELVGHWYRHVKTMIASQYQNVTQQTFGDATAIFSKDQIAGLPLPEDVGRLLAPYRDRLI